MFMILTHQYIALFLLQVVKTHFNFRKYAWITTYFSYIIQGCYNTLPTENMMGSIYSLFTGTQKLILLNYTMKGWVIV